MKLLAPVQNMQGVNAVIFNGAEEIYLGVNQFNARNNIDGFNLETLKDAVIKAHLFGVKVNLAINILFKNCELQSALDTLISAYNLGVDAFIVQDLGLAKLVHDNYPEIVLHASTQMGIHNLEGVKVIEKYGFKRVVLARETPLSEIKRIRDNSDIEIEYFAHGALCVSFSGNCYLSSYLFGASGNRGRCKQLCRLPYTLLKNEKPVKKGYLLSAKDFCTIDKLSELKNAGVSVLKIEGRARRTFYTATVTGAYRRALDGLDYDKKGLELAFNRGFTYGYFENKPVINPLNQNHIGVYLGKIVKINSGRRFNEVFFNSKSEISQGSTIKVFSDGKEKTTLSAFDVKKADGQIYRLTTTQNLAVGDELRLIADGDLEKKAENFQPKKRVEIGLEIRENSQISAEVETPFGRQKIVGDILEKSINSPLTKQQVLECFSKSDLFIPSVNFKAFESVFIAKSKLNEFRRKVYETMLSKTFEFYARNLQSIKVEIPSKNLVFSDYEKVENPSGIFNEKFVIFSPNIYTEKSVLEFKKNCESQGKIPLLDLPNFAVESDVKLLKEIVESVGIKVVANNYYALEFNGVSAVGFGLNVYNQVTANELALPYIPAESDEQVAPLMTFRHCPMKEHLGGSCNNCLFSEGYALKTESGLSLKLRRKKVNTCTFYLEK